jgi:plastocyanin
MSSTVTIQVGDTIRWENRGSVPHNAAAADGSWQSPSLLTGQSYSRRFDVPGEYSYVCTLHIVEEMFGRVVVAAPRRVLLPLAAR